jgi:hypothetical protein
VSFRRSKEAVSPKQRWRSFLREHKRELNATRLPESILADRAAFDHWLMHGHHPADRTGFTIEQMRTDDRKALVQVLAAYFQEGFQDPGYQSSRPRRCAASRPPGGGADLVPRVAHKRRWFCYSRLTLRHRSRNR